MFLDGNAHIIVIQIINNVESSAKIKTATIKINSPAKILLLFDIMEFYLIKHRGRIYGSDLIRPQLVNTLP